MTTVTRPNPAGSPHTVIKDYKHATRIFVDDNYSMSPKYGFVYYVVFELNPAIANIPNNQYAQELGMLVKSVTLPKFTIDTKTHNAYNRPNIVQNKIKYDPVSIMFHDDQGDRVRNFWYDYYSYFYRDPDYNDATYSAPHKYQSRPTFEWGYTPRPLGSNPFDNTYDVKGAQRPYQYLLSIQIYSLYQQQFSQYQLINPIITKFGHGDHSASDTTGLLQHDMSVAFETVKYYTGSVTKDTAGGFVDLHYDNSASPNAAGGPVGQSDSFVTDLANRNTALSFRGEGFQPVATINPSNYFSTALAGSTVLAARAPANSGGLNIPSLGSLTQGLTTASILNQQLKSAGINLVGSAASQLASGVVGGIAKGLGPNGTTLVGLAAAAISNPKALLTTVENMAIQYAVGQATQVLNTLVSSAAAATQKAISGYVTENIAKPFGEAFNKYAAENFSTSIQSTLGIGYFSPDFKGVIPGLGGTPTAWEDQIPDAEWVADNTTVFEFGGTDVLNPIG